MMIQLVLEQNDFNPFPYKPWFLHVCSARLLKTLGKGEIGRNKQFLLFPQFFLPVWITFFHFHYNLKLLSANSVWKCLKFLLGKGLMGLLITICLTWYYKLRRDFQPPFARGWLMYVKLFSCDVTVL